MNGSTGARGRWARAAFVLALAGVVFGLGAQRTSGSSARSNDVAPGDPRRIGYPPGAWHRGDISNVVVGFAHILVRHAASKPQQDGFVVPGPAPARTREEALSKARSIQAQLASDPSKFPDLARQFSEDATTAPRGGRMGATALLALPEHLIDALAVLRPGEVSRVCETELGFHIVKRLEVPAPALVEGREIVVSYDQTSGALRPSHAQEARVRTRDAARALAAQVLALTRSGSDFAALVDKYSDARSADAEGDLGRHPLYDATGEVTFDVLNALHEGEISDVTEDGRAGFRIVQRLKRDRPTMAESAFLIAFRSTAGSEVTRSREEARTLAQELLADVLRDPSSFDRVRAEHCDLHVCDMHAVGHVLGNGLSPVLDHRAFTVAPGEVIPSAVETASGFLIARRETPQKSTAMEATNAYVFEVPSPPEVDERNATSDQISWYLAKFEVAAKERFHLTDSEARTLTATLDQFGRVLESTQDARERTQAVERLRFSLAGSLGKERATALLDFEKHHRAAVFGMDY